MTLYEDQVRVMVDYFKAGETAKADFKVGVELEHIILDKDSLESVSIYGQDGVSQTIAGLADQGWEIDYQEAYAVGAQKGIYTISTEPAGQFELSMEADSSIGRLEEAYVDFIREINPILARQGQVLAGIGYHPVTKIDDIKISPKKRYEYMYDHFKTRGSHSHNMMKGTAAVQVVLDYESEEDFIRKYKAGSALAPILYTIFENAYIFEGQPADIHCVRQYIWKNTDQARSGLIRSAFDDDFSYSSYADYILNNDVIFLDDEKGLRSTGGRLFKDILDPDDFSEGEIFHAVSIVFPDIRLKRYLEYRMMDALPYPLNFAPVALLKGLIYDEGNLKEILRLFQGLTYDEAQEAKDQSIAKGLEATYRGRTMRDWGIALIEMAEGGLEDEEKGYLAPIKDLLDQGLSPRDKFKEIYQAQGLGQAVSQTIIEVKDV